MSSATIAYIDVWKCRQCKTVNSTSTKQCSNPSCEEIYIDPYPVPDLAEDHESDASVDHIRYQDYPDDPDDDPESEDDADMEDQEGVVDENVEEIVIDEGEETVNDDGQVVNYQGEVVREDEGLRILLGAGTLDEEYERVVEDVVDVEDEQDEEEESSGVGGDRA